MLEDTADNTDPQHVVQFVLSLSKAETDFLLWPVVLWDGGKNLQGFVIFFKIQTFFSFPEDKKCFIICICIMYSLKLSFNISIISHSGIGGTGGQMD